ncbi:MAG: VCBS repeat-containing protein, partial [Bacteroidota bacterium]
SLFNFFFLLLPSFLNHLSAQTFNRLDLPVIVDDTPLLNPWVGGLNAPQWSAADLNNDGKPDLYAFDRNGEVHLTWLNIGAAGESKYQFAPEFADHFPRCVHFVLLRDYNRDGAMDLFTHGFIEGLPAFRVFKGKFVNNHLAFDRVEFPQYFADVITIPVAGNYTNLPVNPPDYPAIDDLDGDGDLDILVLSQSLQNIAYYENQAIEKGYTDDTLIYDLKDPCWGRIYLAPFAQSFTLPDPATCECPPGLVATGDDERGGGAHGSASLCTFDDDNDGDKEILFGDLIFPHIIYGKNGGDPEEACIESQDTIYPSYDSPVDLPNFPAAFCLDLDNDGLNDLMASPNVTKTAPDQLVGWFYKNIQSNEFPKFELQQKDLIVKDMLDLGTGAQPAFVDFNADGLMDLAVGNINFYTPDAPMMLVPEEP